MCLAVPAKVISISDNEAVVDYNGVRTTTRLDTLIELLVPGDYVLIHTGFAIRRLSAEDGEETLKLFDELSDSLREYGSSSDEANANSIQITELSSDEKAKPSRIGDVSDSLQETDAGSLENANSPGEKDASSDEKAEPSRVGEEENVDLQGESEVSSGGNATHSRDDEDGRASQ